MRLAFLDSIEKETYGGMEEWVRLVSSGLIKQGHEISIIGRQGSIFLHRLSRSVPEADICGLKISGGFNPVTISTIKQYLIHRGIDILFVSSTRDIRLGGIAARRAGRVKVVWSAGRNISENGLTRRILTPRLVDKIIVPSEFLKRELAQCKHIDSSNVEMIPVGIGDNSSVQPSDQTRDRLRKTYGLPEDATVAVTVGRLIDRNGHEYLVDAALELTRRHPNLHFLFLGDGPNEKTLRRQIAKINLADRFVFAGMVEDVDRELAGCDLMIHPSMEEPFGMALLEGMRAGLPIVASRVGGIPEIVAERKSGLLFDPCNPWAIAETASELLADRDRMKKMGEAGRLRWQKKFNHESMIDRVQRCLMELSGEKQTSTHPDSADESVTEDIQSA